tara:strand:+ start:21 stop:1109 length:1089 start_codon:yes stop_codon:yes gene_type:complete
MIQKKSINIYFAASPLQLICIKEYIIKNHIKEHDLILFLHDTKKIDNENALKQMFLTLNKLKFKRYKIFWIPKIKLMRFLFEILLIIKLKIQGINNNLNFIFFDFRNIFLQSLRRHFRGSVFTLIDDGFYTYVAQEWYMKKNIFLPIERYKSLGGKISKLLYFGFSFKRLKMTPIKIFTIYADELSNNNAEMNTLSFLKRKANESKCKISNKLVFFTGTGMVERGAMKLEQELLLIKTANKYWRKQQKTMYYVGKRSTSQRKLDVFEQNGINTLRFDMPLEIVLSERSQIPGHIMTLGSTLQKSLSLIFDNKIIFYFVNISNFFLDQEAKDLKIKTDEVDKFADSYFSSSSNIKIIDLKDFK